MKTQPTIKYATKDDLNLILEGIYEVCRLEKQKPDKKKDLITITKKAIRKKEIIVAQIDGKSIGFIQFQFTQKSPYGLDYGKWGRKYCWADWIYVEKQNRKQGIGKLLMKEIENKCKRKRIKEIVLDVFEVNKGSLKFHEKVEFKHIIHIMHKKV